MANEVARSDFANLVLKKASECKRKVYEIECPELEGIATLWGLSMDGETRNAFFDACHKATSNQNDIEFAIRVLCNEDGELLFTERDVPEVAKWPASLIQRIFDTLKAPCGLQRNQMELNVKN